MAAPTYRGKSAEQINQMMKSYLPETSGCHYADYPMTSRGPWKKGNETTSDKGEPCFIKTDNQLPPEGIKTAYVWGPGPYTFGYYHLTTKNAHVILYSRIVNNRVQIKGGGDNDCDCCCCYNTSPKDPATQMPPINANDRDILRLLFHARSVSSKPNDAQARADQEAQAKGTARDHYHFDQNIQLAGIVANSMAR